MKFGWKNLFKREKIRFPESQFAHKYLDGLIGIEIGASAHNPFGLSTRNIDYTCAIDDFKRDQLKLCGECAPVDIVAQGDNLPLRDNQVDFVVSSHVIEHFFDPIATINEWLRVSRKYVLMVVPHKKRTYDINRVITTAAELQLRHEKKLTPSEVNNPNQRYFNGVIEPYGHWSVWDTESFLDLCKNQNWEVIDFQDVDDKVGNGFTVLLKVPPT